MFKETICEGAGVMSENTVQSRIRQQAAHDKASHPDRAQLMRGLLFAMRGLGRCATIALPLAAILTMPAVSYGQKTDAQVSGTVRDQSGSLVPDAEITATQTATGVVTTAKANSDGLFTLPPLQVGPYDIVVVANGFEQYRQVHLVLTVGQQLSLNVTLKIGAATEAVTVTAASVSVDSSTPTEQQTIDQKTIEELPLNGRNPADLLFTVAGISDPTIQPVATSNTTTIKPLDAVNPSASAPVVHGVRPGGTYFSLDGVSNTDPYTVIGGPFPNPDAAGEFSVVTGTYGARYPSAPGGAVNIVTRSGTNAVHGTVFEFLRNGYVNASNRFSTVPDTLKRNQFGFALGAPLLRDKLFAFASYQGSIIHSSATNSAIVPTALQRTGDFGSFKVAVSPAIQKILQFFPVGDPTTGQVFYSVPTIQNDTQAVFKLDYNLGAHKLFARAFYDRYTSPASQPTAQAGVLSEGTGRVLPWASYAVGDDFTRGKFNFESRVDYLNIQAVNSSSQQLFSFANMGITNLNGYYADPGYSLLIVSGAFTAGNNSVTSFPRKQFQATEDVFLSLGRQTISFGADYRHAKYQQDSSTGQNPIAYFYGVNSFIFGHGFNAMADFISGAPYFFDQSDGQYSSSTADIFGLYGEDNFKLSKRLTATAGLRWDPFIPNTPEYVDCFVPGRQSTVYTNALTGLLYPGDAGCPSKGINSKLNLFEPRLGLAYQLDDSGKTVLRSGYGMYALQLPAATYFGFSTQPFVRTLAVAQPFLSIDNIYGSAGLADPFTAGFHGLGYRPPANATFQTGLAASTFDPRFRPSYVQQWSLSLQQLLSAKDSVEIAYNGNNGMHLTEGRSLNTPVYNNNISLAANQASEQARRPYQQFGNISDLTSDATSSYNGIDITYNHRSSLFSVTSAFSWQKTMDEVSYSVLANGINTPSTHNFHRGRSDFDQNFLFRNTFTATGPRFQGAEHLVRAVAGGWTAAGLVTLDAGFPFSAVDINDPSATGLGFDLADRVPGQPLYLQGAACAAGTHLANSVPSCLNPAAFTSAAPGTNGNSGRNTLRSSPIKDVDLALAKHFPVYERVSANFRAEAFNLFNHPNLGAPNYNYGQAGFGDIQTAAAPRILQFSLKLDF